MATNFITCITKPNAFSTLEHIEGVGGVTLPGGATWYYTLEQIVQMIDSGQYEFYVRVGLYQVPVRTYWHGSRKFIRTSADSTMIDNLLSLDQCPLYRAA